MKALPTEYFVLCLIFPLSELFPNLCLGWWSPPNLDITTHRQRRIVRTLLQLLAWFPIMWSSGMLIESDNVSLLVIGVFAAYGLRFALFTIQLENIEADPLWKTNIEPTRRTALLAAMLRRKPQEITSFRTAVEKYVGLSTKILACNFIGVATMVHRALPENELRAYFALAAVLLGGRGIESMRYMNENTDVFFRFLLATGFIYLVYLLTETLENEHAINWVPKH